MAGGSGKKRNSQHRSRLCRVFLDVANQGKLRLANVSNFSHFLLFDRHAIRIRRSYGFGL
jgi:hypothetical protein